MYRITQYVEAARAAGYTVETRAVDASGIHVTRARDGFYRRFTGIGEFQSWVRENCKRVLGTSVCGVCGNADATPSPSGWVCAFCHQPWNSVTVVREALAQWQGLCSRCYEVAVIPGGDFCQSCLEIYGESSPANAPRFLGDGTEV